MKYMLDTNICSYIIKHRPKEVLEKFNTVAMEDCCISLVTYAELKYWVVRNKRLHTKNGNTGDPKVNEQIISQFISHLEVEELDTSAADCYADIRDATEAQGIVIGNADLLIAAHAISLKATLVTNNIKDFIAIPKLMLENWVSNTTK